MSGIRTSTATDRCSERAAQPPRTTLGALVYALTQHYFLARLLRPYYSHAVLGKVPSVEIVQALLGAGANASAKDKFGKTPLDIATTRGLTEIVAAIASG
jgi:ankyrin repeat protein